jgi:hypothetical protein
MSTTTTTRNGNREHEIKGNTRVEKNNNTKLLQYITDPKFRAKSTKLIIHPEFWQEYHRNPHSNYFGWLHISSFIYPISTKYFNV